MKENPQSLWHPVSLMANDIKDLSLFLIIMSTVVLMVTFYLLYLAVKKTKLKSNNSFEPQEKFILWAGLFIPTVILLVTFVWSLQSSLKISQMMKEEAGLTIKVIAHQFWWEVEYPELNIITANEIHIPRNTNIKFELSSRDVIHSFWIPKVHGKIDMLPDHPTYLAINVKEAGEYRGQCAEFCGVQHALMAFPLVVLAEEDFKVWHEYHQKKNIQTLSPSQTSGKQIYQRESCHTCHTIQGTSFIGKAGPDLTHLASRLTLGAATIPNNRKNLAEWIRDSQQFKPHNRMPHYKTLPNQDLSDLVDYLGSLK